MLSNCSVWFPLFFRNGISFKTFAGESNSVRPEMISAWNQTTLPTLLTNFKLKNIYNADEFGLLFQCLPNKSYQIKSEKCSDGKNNKLRVTGMPSGNAVGDKLPMFVIGKSKNHRCYKHVKPFPCRYIAQPKSWMGCTLCEDWVREINRKFQTEDWKVVLIVDNCPAHPRNTLEFNFPTT